MTDVETLGQRVRRLRVRAGYRRPGDLASVIGMCTRGAVEFWEADARMPLGRNIAPLAKALRVSEHYLLTGEAGDTELVDALKAAIRRAIVVEKRPMSDILGMVL